MDSLFLKSFTLEFFLLLSLLCLLLYNIFVIMEPSWNFPLIDKEVFYQVIFILLISLILNFNNKILYISTFGLFTNDLGTINTKMIVLVSILFSIICGKPYFLKHKINLFEYYILLLLASFSLLCLTSSTDLITLYLCLEMQSLCFYVLAAFNRYSVFSTESALKYFVLGAVASCLFLFGSSIIYLLTGTTNLFNLSLIFNNLNVNDINSAYIYISLLFILVTIFFKIAAAPFHIWSPDVYEGAPLSSSIFFILVPKTIFLLLILRLFYMTFFDYFFIIKNVFIFCGILSILVGSFVALQQKRIKRLLIYSSISHIGFILLGYSTGTFLGITSVFYYIIFYIITGFLVWGILSLLTSSQSNKFIYLTDYSNLGTTNPALGFALGLGLFSLAGIPPLVGFSMKLFIFEAAINAEMYEISVAIILLSIISSFYYLRFIKIIFFEKKNNFNNMLKDTSFNNYLSIVIALSLFLILFGFINPNLILLFSYKLGLNLFFI